MNQNNQYDQQTYEQMMRNNAAYMHAVKATYDAGTSQLREATQLVELQNKIAAMEDKEEAYSSIIESNSGLAVRGITGTLKQLYKIGITNVIRLIPDPLYRQEHLFILKAENGNTLTIPESMLYQDRKLLSAMALVLGKPARIYSTAKNIAELVREYIVSRAKTTPFPYYYGWRMRDNQCVFTLRGYSTHAPILPTSPDAIPQEEVFGEESKGHTLSAAERIADAFLQMRTENRTVLFLWLHLACIYTILAHYCMAPAMGLSICCQGPISQMCLEKLFCWYGDGVISLGISQDQLCKKLADRKDEPIVLDDRHAKEGNCELVHRVVAEGLIPFSSKSEHSTMLMAPVILLSNGASVLCCKSNFFTIEMDESSWECSDPATITAKAGYLSDYLRGFISYVKDHSDQLLSCLRAGSAGLESFELEDFSPEAFTTFTVLRGLREFLKGWQTHLALSKDQAFAWNDLLADKDYNLVQLLRKASTAGDDLTSCFLAITRRMVQTGDLFKLRVDTVPNVKEITEMCILTDEDSWYLSRSAFSTIAKSCDASTVVLARSLNANHLLKGRPASGSTYMTRISVYDEVGNSRGLRVYAFDKRLFEDRYSDFDIVED